MTERDLPHPQPSKATADFVDALLCIGGQLALTIDHMARHASPDAEESAPEVLRRLLTEIMEDELAAPAGDVETAASVLRVASGAIEENLFLVPTPEPAPPSPGQANGHEAR